MKPNFIALEQNSNDWKRWRARGIGSSCAPTIMFENPSKSPFALWQEYMGLRELPYETRFMERGKRLEDDARKAYEERTGTIVRAACYEHPAFEYLRCSADGAAPVEKPSIIAEIKCPDKLTTHLSAREGVVPIQHYGQCQHLLMVSQADVLHYASWWHGELEIVEVFVDENYQDELLRAEHRFWKMVCDERWIAPDGEKDMSCNRLWMEKSTRFKQADELFEHYRQLRDTAAAELAQLCGMETERAFGNGVEARWTHTVRAAERSPRKAIDSWNMKIEQTPDKRID
jgi:putative phage-type endonuclease